MLLPDRFLLHPCILHCHQLLQEEGHPIPQNLELFYFGYLFLQEYFVEYLQCYYEKLFVLQTVH